jgi:hypothetical protein
MSKYFSMLTICLVCVFAVTSLAEGPESDIDGAEGSYREKSSAVSAH